LDEDFDEVVEEDVKKVATSATKTKATTSINGASKSLLKDLPSNVENTS
jgi:hypothetical protein